MNDLTKKDSAYYGSSRADMRVFAGGEPKRILEIGCGAGGFATNFHNAEYWGVEPNVEMAKKAASGNRRILNGTYEDVASKIPNQYFDLIACNDVIEHMINPILFLSDIKGKLHPNGRLIASVPNIRNIEIISDLLFHDKFDYTTAGLLDYTHLHFFTKSSFKKIAQSCGWHIEACETITSTSIRPWKSIILKAIEFFVGDLRTYQFAVCLTPSTMHPKQS